MARDLIVFGEDWGGLPSSTQHLVARLAKDRAVVWINSIGLRQPRLRMQDLSRLAKKLVMMLGERKRVRSNTAVTGLRVVNPRTLPAPRSKVARWVASQLLSRQVKSIAEQERIKDPILWASLPTAVDVVGQLGESAVVYYCGDDFSALAGVDHDTVTRRESSLIEKANLVLAASDALAHRIGKSVVTRLPHGVDHDLFAAPKERAVDLPNDGRPIAGFYGSISEWIDQDLLIDLSQRLPHWHFVLIGKTEVDVSALKTAPNVTFLGPRAHDELPRYSQHWTASILPFKDSPQIRACNPLKLREYLAAGRPVVSTVFPAATEYCDVISLTNHPGRFAHQLERATRLIGRQEDLITRVAPETWDARASQVADLLDQL
jgi:glycosyltransferase involved in cell wall biosynthesis